VGSHFRSHDIEIVRNYPYIMSVTPFLLFFFVLHFYLGGRSYSWRRFPPPWRLASWQLRQVKMASFKRFLILYRVFRITISTSNYCTHMTHVHKYYSITPPSPPRGGDGFDLCVFIGYKYWVRLHSDMYLIPSLHSDIAYTYIHYMSEQFRLFSCGMCIQPQEIFQDIFANIDSSQRTYRL
jgi:hypothetical protein